MLFLDNSSFVAVSGKLQTSVCLLIGLYLEDS